jgi:very-short-patch-repair endonuclease
MSKKKTKEEFIIDSVKIHGNKYDYSLVEYVSNSTKVSIICEVHGEFEVRPNDHLSKKVGCNKCNNGGISKLLNTKKNIVDRFNMVHNSKYDYSLMNYLGTDIKISIICPIHGVFHQRPHHHLNGIGCQECGNVKPLNTDSFIEKAVKVHNDFYNYSLVDYKNTNTKVKIICPNHGVFEQAPNSHLSGKNGCPICKSSKGELTIKQWLDGKNINYIQQYRFPDCRNILPLSFDFYLPDYNMCIEYDGRQHFGVYDIFGGNLGYEKTKKRDGIKTNYCEENGVLLLRIKYNDNILNKLENTF